MSGEPAFARKYTRYSVLLADKVKISEINQFLLHIGTRFGDYSSLKLFLLPIELDAVDDTESE